MIIVSSLCLARATKIFRQDPDNPLANYILWFCIGIFAFSVSRSTAHIIKHILYFTGHAKLWIRMSPVSGAINTMTFIVIAAITPFFHRMESIMHRMKQDRLRLKKTSQEILKLNRTIENIVSERTRAEMALRIAHEIRNPVTVIGGLLRHILKKRRNSMEENEWLVKILEQSQKLEALVSKIENAWLETKSFFTFLDVNKIVDDAVNAIKIEAEEKGITISLDKSDSNLFFQGNDHLIKAAITHILRNAIEACSHGNTIHITTSLGDKGINVEIRDDGPGIHEMVIKNIFTPFTTTSQGETGLGLPYVRQIIEEHRGEIKIESELGRGTKVTITLPTHIGELAN